jgi:uncharacterized protein DUF1707
MTTGTTGDSGTGADSTVGRQDGGPRMRASDAERSATVGVLQDAVARGLLSHDEGAQRMAIAFAARFRDELPQLTADLPPEIPPASAPTAVGWHSLGSSLVAQLRHELAAGVAAGPGSRRVLAVVVCTFFLLGLLVTVGGLAVHGLFVDGGHDHFLGPGAH